MKTLGIVGGIAPSSTIEYYREYISAWRARVTDGTYPQVVINSMNLTPTRVSSWSDGRDHVFRLKNGRYRTQVPVRAARPSGSQGT